jgi:hypothetical protein
VNERTRTANRPKSGGRLRIGSIRLTIPLIVVSLILLGSIVFIGWVMLNVRDDQIPLLSVGFFVLGVSFAALAIGAVLGMWRAASRAEGGRAFALAIAGGLAGLAAIGSFAVTTLLALLLNT